MLLCMDWGVDVALRLSYQTPLLLSTFMKSQEEKGGARGRTGSYAVKYLQ